MGVAHHGDYFAWFEVGRTDLLRERGMTYRELEAEGLRLPVIEATRALPAARALRRRARDPHASRLASRARASRSSTRCAATATDGPLATGIDRARGGRRERPAAPAAGRRCAGALA